MSSNSISAHAQATASVDASVTVAPTVLIQMNNQMPADPAGHGGLPCTVDHHDSCSVGSKGRVSLGKKCKGVWKRCKSKAKKLWKNYRVWQFLTVFFMIWTIVFLVLFLVYYFDPDCGGGNGSVSAPIEGTPQSPETCSPGACNTLVPIECAPMNCTNVQCVEPTGCEYTPIDCGSGFECNVANNKCEAVNCTANDPWMCTDDFFLDGACTSKANNTKCDDNDFCTLDFCMPNDEGAASDGCVHTPTNPCAPCDNGKPAKCVLNQCECPTCSQKVDMVFVLDSSGSIGANFPNVKKFAQNIASAFLADPNFGVVSFSTVSTIQKELGSCPLDSLTNKTEQSCVQSVIAGIQGPSGRTNTPAALKDAVELFKGTGDRPDVPNVALVFTDGVPNIVGIGALPNVTCLPFQSETDATVQAAKELQAVATVIGLGVGIPTDGVCCKDGAVCNKDPLGVVQGIATPPASENFVSIDDFSSLDTVKNRIVTLLCPDN